MKQRVLVVGASSGIGEELARQLANRGARVAVTGRRLALLKKLLKKMGAIHMIAHMDVRKSEASIKTFQQLSKKMGGFDLVILSAGWGDSNDDSWAVDKQTIETNVLGFTALANAAWQSFKRQGYGQLVNISSIAALRGGRHATAYNASKAYVSSYMEGLRAKASHEKLDITLTDIQPGFVDTAMAQSDRVFWSAPVDKACRQIIKAIDQKKDHAYVTKRWRLIAWLMKCLPGWLYRRLG